MLQLTDLVTKLPLVGPKNATILERLGVRTISDLLFYFPRAYEDASKITTIDQIKESEKNTIRVKINSLYNIRTRRGLTMQRGSISDSTGILNVIWFNQPYLVKTLKRQEEYYLSGMVKRSGTSITLQSPTFEKLQTAGEQIHTGRIVPVYRETTGISSKWLRHKIKLALDRIPNLPDHLPAQIKKSEKLIDLLPAIHNIHFPKTQKTYERAKYRLAFDELLALQLIQKRIRIKWKTSVDNFKIIPLDTKLLKKDIASLPFQLTQAQRIALFDILADLKSGSPMLRLLEGDVGSGKTIVAFLALLHTIHAGYQGCLIAPTEILAVQHYENIMKVAKPYGCNIQLLVGSLRLKQKNDIKKQIATGTVDIVIGTHALVQKDVQFHNLGLCVIDEQHRFGVQQRNQLRLTANPHILSMTATPIPRSLALTVFGEQDLSIIDQMPAGRTPITTRIIPQKKQQDAYKFIDLHIAQGRQVFVICPLIEESEALDVISVQEETAILNKIFPHRSIVSLHGKLKSVEKEKIMQEFKAGNYDILVATSVIEVGIDIPNTSIMLIEGAERFGLAQLHQFRGRVGRGLHKSFCLLNPSKHSSSSLERLKALEQHTSGFKLAEIDLKLRGPGEVFGTRQSGIPDLRIADFTNHKLIALTRKYAEQIISDHSLYQQIKPLLNTFLRTKNAA